MVLNLRYYTTGAGKPPSLMRGMRAPFLLRDWGIGVLLLRQNIHLYALLHEYLYIDRYATISLVVHKQQNSVKEGPCLPWLKHGVS